MLWRLQNINHESLTPYISFISSDSYEYEDCIPCWGGPDNHEVEFTFMTNRFCNKCFGRWNENLTDVAELNYHKGRKTRNTLISQIIKSNP